MARGPELVKALSGVVILVVDDSAEARDLLESVFGYCGAVVELAMSVNEALDLFRRRPVDIVIVGVVVLDGDAHRLVHELHAMARTDGPVPVVAVAGRDVSERALREGFESYVRRPIDPWELCRVVAALVRRA